MGQLWGTAGGCGADPSAPQHVLLTLTYSELCWELVGAVGQEGDAMGQEGEAVGPEGEAAEPPQLWLEFDGDHEGAPVNRLLRVFSPQVRPTAATHKSTLGGGGRVSVPMGGSGAQLSPPQGGCGDSWGALGGWW